jgi:arsenate reductase (thioredoxin)
MSDRHILFMCVANSARSQMAEGLARHHAPEGVTIYSAGSEPSRVRPQAIEVMSEIGIDVTGHSSKGVDALPVALIDTVITLCAEEVCPVFPGQVERLDWGMPDPAGHEDEPWEAQLARFRVARDAIQAKVIAFFG